MKILQLELPGGRQTTALHYGPSSPQGILFFHGTGYSGLAWKPDEAELSRRNFRMIVPQRPGTGDSPLYPGFTVGELAGMFKNMLEQLEVQTVYLLGYATGAAYAAAFAHAFPEMVTGLGLLNPALPLTGESLLPASWRKIMNGIRYAPLLLRWRIQNEAKLLKRNPEIFVERAIRQYAMVDRVHFEQFHFRLALIEDLKYACRQGSVGIWHDLKALYGFRWSLGGLSVPVTIRQGKFGRDWSETTAMACKNMHPAARIEVLSDAGTWIGINNPLQGFPYDELP